MHSWFSSRLLWLKRKHWLIWHQCGKPHPSCGPVAGGRELSCRSKFCCSFNPTPWRGDQAGKQMLGKLPGFSGLQIKGLSLNRPSTGNTSSLLTEQSLLSCSHFGRLFGRTYHRERTHARWPAVPLLRAYTQQACACGHRELCARMFIAVFVIAPNWNVSRCWKVVCLHNGMQYRKEMIHSCTDVDTATWG